LITFSESQEKYWFDWTHCWYGRPVSSQTEDIFPL